jgi:uncharacterized protein YqeY
MSLFEQINKDIKQAMLNKEKDKLEALRAIKAAFLLAKTEKGNAELTPEKELEIVKKLVKQRKDSAEIYLQNGRKDLAETELFQASIIEKYLPEQLSDEEIEKEVQNIITETGASSMKDMGKVMGIATKKFAGRADNKKVADIVKKLLGS